MGRYVFAPIPFTGHINPGLPIARELVRRGHDVRWFSTPRFRHAIEQTGARFRSFRNALPLDEENLDIFPDRPASGLAQLRYDVKNIFVEFVRGALDDLEGELLREPADVIVGDNASAVVEAVYQKFGIKWALYGMTLLAVSSRDTAPFGLALPPSSTLFGRLRNRALSWVFDNVIFREAARHNAAMRRDLGLPPLRTTLFDWAKEADLYLQGGIPAFDYPRTDLPSNVRYVGATIPDAPVGWKRPTWWSELGKQRVILVTQGTINNDFDQLIRPAIRALAEENVLVIVTTGSRPAEDVGIDPLPSNVIVERYVPYKHLMPHVDLLLTNGGYGSIQIALAHGAPVVAIGKTEDKAEIANRVEWSGVGVGLKVLVATEAQIRDAVTRVLMYPSYQSRAAEFRTELGRIDGARAAADLLEELAGEVAPAFAISA